MSISKEHTGFIDDSRNFGLQVSIIGEPDTEYLDPIVRIILENSTAETPEDKHTFTVAIYPYRDDINVAYEINFVVMWWDRYTIDPTDMLINVTLCGNMLKVLDGKKDNATIFEHNIFEDMIIDSYAVNVSDDLLDLHKPRILANVCELGKFFEDQSKSFSELESSSFQEEKHTLTSLELGLIIAISVLSVVVFASILSYILYKNKSTVR